MPYRIAAPPEPDPLDVEEPYAAMLRAQRSRARLVSVLVAIFVALGVAKVARSGQPPPRNERSSSEAARVLGARTAIADARARAAAAQVRFEVGVRDAIGRDVGPRPDLGVCPIKLPAASSLTAGRSGFPLLTIDRAEIKDTLPSQAVAEVLADVRRAEGHLAAGRFEEAALYARALGRPERFGYDIVLVARAAKAPRARSGAEYDPGEIEGRAYLYEFASGRVVCAGDVRAKSSRAIGYVFSDRPDRPARLGPVASMGDAIDDDIRLQTQRAIVEGVRYRADTL